MRKKWKQVADEDNNIKKQCNGPHTHTHTQLAKIDRID